MDSPSARRPCFGTMNLEGAGRCRSQGAADVSSAELFSDSSAGKMPAAPYGSWRAPICFRTRIGTMNWFVLVLVVLLVLENVQTGWVVEDEDENEDEDEWPGSWKAPTILESRIGP